MQIQKQEKTSLKGVKKRTKEYKEEHTICIYIYRVQKTRNTAEQKEWSKEKNTKSKTTNKYTKETV